MLNASKVKCNRPMSLRNDRDVSEWDYSRNWESDNTGGKVEVTRYADGSSTYHFGGPCGPIHFDSNGEMC